MQFHTCAILVNGHGVCAVFQQCRIGFVVLFQLKEQIANDLAIIQRCEGVFARLYVGKDKVAAIIGLGGL